MDAYIESTLDVCLLYISMIYVWVQYYLVMMPYTTYVYNIVSISKGCVLE